jgi:hypothetical protein
LAQHSSNAYKAKYWRTLEKLSKELFLLLRAKIDSKPADIHSVAKNYLASILAQGRFLLNDDPIGLAHFQDGVKALKNFLGESSPKLRIELRSELHHVQQVQLLLTHNQSDSLNKASSSLRRLARPDLAIELTSSLLEKSRLNYYALVVRGSAFVDLLQIDHALKDGELALKHSPAADRNYALTLLARAYREKFRTDGDFDSLEKALELALESLSIRKDPYIARVFISIVRAIGTTEYDQMIEDLKSSLNFTFDRPDPLAIDIAERLVEDQANTEIIHDDDPWADLEDDVDFSFLDKDFQEESIEDYFSDYFEDFEESLNDPRSPHLEP